MEQRLPLTPTLTPTPTPHLTEQEIHLPSEAGTRETLVK